jgi:hypothetical protein
MIRITVAVGTQGATIIANLSAAIERLPPLLMQNFQETGDRGVAQLAEATPVSSGDTGGHLQDSYRTTAVQEELHLDVLTEQAEKLNWVRYGTGLEGPLHHMVLPRVRLAMWWVNRPYTPPHPVPRTRGQRPHDFVTPVTDELVSYSITHIASFAEQLAWVMEGRA